MSNLLVLNFNSIQLDVIDKDGQAWIKSIQLAMALGYKEENAITKLYNRNADEFTEKMTQVVEILDIPNLGITDNLASKARIFSLRGCHLIAMFARTAVAKTFRVWVLDIIEKHNNPQPKPLTPSTPADRQPLRALMDVWVKESHQSYTNCWRQLNSAFNFVTIESLPLEWLPDAIAFVQARIDAIPKAIEPPKHKDILQLIGEKYDLKGFDNFNLGSHQVKDILAHYPNVGEYTLKAIMIKAKYMKAISQVYRLGIDLKKELDSASSVPHGTARETLNKTGICADHFIYAMVANHWDVLEYATKFHGVACHAINSLVCVARMQDL